MAHELGIPYLHARESRIRTLLSTKESERPGEITNIHGISALIDEQSTKRLYPYTSGTPFAYAEMSHNGKWTPVQIEGIPPGHVNTNPIRFSNSEGGFLAYKEVEQRRDREETPVINITPSWFDDQHRIRALEPKAVKGKRFFHWATIDRTLLSRNQLRDEFNKIHSQNTDPYKFPELYQLISIAKALAFRGDDETAAKVLAHIETVNETKIRKKDRGDIREIKNRRKKPLLKRIFTSQPPEPGSG